MVFVVELSFHLKYYTFMDRSTILQLNTINNTFYKTVAQDFSDSRSYYWHGWREFLPFLENMLGETDQLEVLDVGCGNGRFGLFLVDSLPSISINYLGIDSNKQLLEIAKKSHQQTHLDSEFAQLDIVQSLLDNTFLKTKKTYDVIVLFGLLHHIPSFQLRKQLVQMASKKLKTNGLLILTLWRFLDTNQLQKKQVAFEQAELNPAQLDKNDFILSWNRGKKSIRYCHYADKDEEARLLSASELELLSSFESDGKEGRGNRYLVLTRPSEV